MRRHAIYFALLAALVAPPASAQWKQTNGPYGGTINCLAVCGSNLFAGTDGAGVFRSSDEGLTWATVNSGLADLFVKSLAVSGTNLFAGTATGGVFRSDDNGSTWSAVNNGLPLASINCFVVSGTNLYAVTEAGIFLTTNSGASWSTVRGTWSERIYEHGFDCLAVLGSNLIASKWNVAFPTNFRSTDNGATWSTFVGEAGWIRTFAVVGPNVFAASGGAVYSSSDSGSTWTASGLADKGVYLLMTSGSELYAATYKGYIFRSTDAGTNWTVIGGALPSSSAARSLAVFDANVYAGTGGHGVFRSSDGNANWTTLNSGLTNTGVASLIASGTTVFAGTRGCGVFRSTNGGRDWVAINDNLSNQGLSFSFLAASGTTLFAETEYPQRFYRSTDSGGTWTEIQSLAGTDALSFAALGDTLFVGTNFAGVFRSTDDGVNWTAVNNGLHGNWISALAVLGTELFAGTFSVGTGNDAVYHSTNEGETWTASGLPGRSIASLVVSGTKIFAGTYDSNAPLFLSTDGGTSWTAASNGLPAYPVWSLAVAGTNLFAGNYYGVFRTSDNGARWTAVSNGLIDTRIGPLAISGGNLWAGTDFCGVWTRPLSELVAGTEPREEGDLPVDFALFQNYPNPFNPRTEVRSQTPEVSHVRIVIYDVLGREVAVLVNERRAAGRYQDTFDGSMLSSGIYICRMTAGAFVQTRKMLLIK